jgi:tetratricopeptide (TPR) repeat protein
VLLFDSNGSGNANAGLLDALLDNDDFFKVSFMSIDSSAYYEVEIGRRMAQGDLSGAASAAEACRAAWPQATAGWLFGSVIALLNDDKQTALALIEQPLSTDPANAQCLLQKAEVLLALRQREEALAVAKAAAAGSDDNPAALDALGEFFVHAAEHELALEIYDRAIAATPREATLRAKRADLHRYLGNLELAAQDYESVLALTPGAAKALMALVEMRRQSPDQNSVAALKAALAVTKAGSADASILNFGLGKAYQDLGDYDGSWRHLATANAIEHGRIQYEPTTDRAVVESMIAGFPDAGPQRLGTTGAAPIFIVGLPRTGSTLVERIISSHSLVRPEGETTALPAALDAAMDRSVGHSFPDREHFVSALHSLDGQLIAEEYLALIRAQGGGDNRLTDKLLSNFLYCPLMLRAFPQARIINVTRHPLAACYAIFRARFNGTNTFSYDLRDIGEFYIGYRKIMAHWHSILPGRILDVAYEDVVTAIEPTTRKMLDYLDLPFEAQCLQFHKNTAPVRTASVTQVRQPLYDSSLNMWQHYSEQLAPLGERLRAAGIPLG